MENRRGKEAEKAVFGKIMACENFIKNIKNFFYCIYKNTVFIINIY